MKLCFFLSILPATLSFAPYSPEVSKLVTSKVALGASTTNNLLDGFLSIFQPNSKNIVAPSTRRVAKELVTSLVTEDFCFTTETGAQAFAASCSDDVVYEDCYEPDSPFEGREAVLQHMLRKVKSRQGKGELRMDRISDGSKACGFAWTYTCGDKEGLRGTTFVELNEQEEVIYVREIPEPLYKPGNLTLKLLEAVTKGAKPRPDPVFIQRTPTVASDIAKYLFQEVNGDLDESMRFFDENILYRDFNFEEPLQGASEVEGFIKDFTFPGITFVLTKCDDGIESTSFTWEVLLSGQEKSIKGVSLYEINPMTKKIEYVRDIPESSIKPPPLGQLARLLRPGLGVFNGVELGSRPGGK